MALLGMTPSTATAVLSPDGANLTYADLMTLSTEFGARLGPEPSLTVILARNDRATVVGYLGALMARRAVALVDGLRPLTDALPILEAYRPAWLLGPGGTGAALDALGAPVVRTDAAEGGGELVRLGYPRPVRVHPDLALLLTTSGSTGSRKFVRLGARSVESNAHTIAAYLGLDPSERAVTALPLHYSMGLSVLNSHLAAGASLLLTEASVMEARFWDAFREQRCTSLAGVPFTYVLLERVGFREMTLPHLRHLQQAGGALDLRLTALYDEHMRARGGRFFVMYGATEATARMAYVPPERLAAKVGSAGRAIPGGTFSIRPVEEHAAATLATGGPTIGEVLYAGDNVMFGYASGADDLVLGDVLHGTLETGDIGYLDDEGFLYIVGRSKRIAKVYGIRINLDEVELRLRTQGPAAVVAGPDAILGYCAFGDDEVIDGLARDLAKQLRVNRAAIRLLRVEELPTLPSGKVDYQRLETSVGRP